MKAFVAGIILLTMLSTVRCTQEDSAPQPEKKPVVAGKIVKPEPKNAEHPFVNKEGEISPEKTDAKRSPEEAVPEIQAKGAADRGIAEPPQIQMELSPVPDDADIKDTPLQGAPTQGDSKYYIVKRGESFESIAGRDDVFGDPLKWPILYRLNRDNLGDFPTDDNLPVRLLPEEIKIRISGSPAGAGADIKKAEQALWVINVQSARSHREVIPPAVLLLKNGYPVYLTKARVKGKTWVRLRLGFYSKKQEADSVRETVMKLLNTQGLWSARAGAKEIEAFGEFLAP